MESRLFLLIFATKTVKRRSIHKPGGRLLGFGDFTVYNVLLLIALSLFSSTEAKLWVAFGFIISNIIGQLGTYYFKRLWKLNGMPGMPLPMICFSTYVLLLDVMITSSHECDSL